LQTRILCYDSERVKRLHSSLGYDCGVSEFEAETENSALKEKIAARIRGEGPISFRDFMAMALYEPGLGYYTSDRVVLGRQGDYLTSPEVSPVFGAMVGRQLREMWEALGSPGDFHVVEAGGGSAALARDILTWARRVAPEMLAAIHYTIVEISATLENRQRNRLEAEGFAEKVRWEPALLTEVEGVILSNELLDAFPVHLVTVKNGRMQEVHVIAEGDRFQEIPREPRREVSAHLESIGIQLTEGVRAEVNLDSITWMRTAARALRRGFVITIDYGYEAADLYAPWRTDGTLLCFYRHNPGHDPYVRVGKQDMTSHIDLTAVRRAGEEAGLATLGLVSQSQFLTNLGIGEALQPPEGGDLEGYFARRRAVTELLDPAGLGRISVLIQARGMGQVKLTGMRHD